MPISALDSKAALVIIDLQKGIVPRIPPGLGSQIVSRSATLAQAFRDRNLPVVLVHVTGLPPGRTGRTMPNFNPPADWADLVPELNQQPSDILITKRAPGAILGTSLHEQLTQLGVTQFILTGVATSLGVESTARSAYDLGYNVVFVTDAMADVTPENHTFTVENIFPRLGESGSTADLLALLK